MACDLAQDTRGTAAHMVEVGAVEDVVQQVDHRWRCGHHGTVAIPQVGTQMMSVTVEQDVYPAVAMLVERPRARTRFVEMIGQRHRLIVAEGHLREQYDRLWS